MIAIHDSNIVTMLTKSDRYFSGEETERAPVWVMRQAGRYLPGRRLLNDSDTIDLQTDRSSRM